MDMNYQQAERIRNRSFGSLLGEQEGGFGESLRKTISLRGQARMKGIKERFDPLNIAKFITGGSNFAPAALGKIFGRSKEDIARFSGSRLRDDSSNTATKIERLESENQTLDILMKIYEFMQKSYEDKVKQRDAENAFAEENKLEKDRQHDRLIAAITGKPVEIKEKETTEKVEKDKDSFVGDALAAFGGLSLAKSALSTLATVAKFFAFSPVGLAILGSTALGVLFWKLFSDKSGYEDPNSELSKGLKQAESVGGLAGVKDEAERRKKMPEYDRTMAEIKDFETYQNEGDKLNDQQLKGYANRGPGALEAVEDYKLAREQYNKIVGAKATASPVPDTATPSETTTPTPPSPVSEAPATAPAASQKLSQVQNENLDLSIPQSSTDPSTVVNNNSVKSYDKTGTKIPMPSVRNQEPTFANMILYSTRVV
jgi:transcriptional regulator with XRE-family HTH domain